MNHRRLVFGILAGGVALGVAGSLRAQGAAPSDAADRSAIAATLAASAQAWSRGDLDGFMQCYERSPSVFYVGHDGLVHGYDAIHAMYAGRFAAGYAMGRLSLETMQTQVLGPDYALVAGRFMLARSQGDSHGIFTLVFHRTSAGWRIVADHTS